MLKCTPLYPTLSLRRCSSSRLMQPNTFINQNPSDVKPSYSGKQMERSVENQGVDKEDRQCDPESTTATIDIRSAIVSPDIQTIGLNIETV